MAIKICLDAGHFGKYNQSKVYPTYYESDMAWKLHLLLKKELEKYGFEVITTRENKDIDLALGTRGAMSKGCDLFISLHSNASNTESVDRAVVIPYQDVIWTDIDDKSRAIAEKLGACVTDVMGLSSYQIYPRKAGNDRDGNGKLDDEYYGVLYGSRKVGTPGIIVEHGFHTNTKCAKWLSDDSNLSKMAIAEAEVIANYFGVKKTEKTQEKTSGTIYRVQVGAYSKKPNAEAILKKLKAAGFKDAYITETNTEPTKTIWEIAEEVIKGNWGVGQDRKILLTSAGYDYEIIQKIVNDKLKK